MQQEQQMHDSELQQQMQLLQEKQQFEASENQKDREEKIYIAEIQAASKAATAKTPDMGEEAYQKGLDRVEAQNNFRETMNLNTQKHLVDTKIKEQTLSIREKEIQAENRRTAQQLQNDKLSQKVKEKSAKNTKK